jgi:hypothetical protein
MRMFRPLVGTAVAAGALAGGLALGLSLTGASAATTASTTTASTTTTHTANTATETSAARSPAVTAAPSGTSMKKGTCTHMSGGSRGFPSHGSGPGGASSSPAASS